MSRSAIVPFLVNKSLRGSHTIDDGVELDVLAWDVKSIVDYQTKVIKSAEKQKEERFVMGVVLEPTDGSDGAELKPDTDNDVYSAEEVRKAAHWYMEHGHKVGLLHGPEHGGEILERSDNRVVVVESYLTPVDLQPGALGDRQKEKIQKGTWIMAFKVNDDKIWSLVKSGRLDGLSIGGVAISRDAEE